MKKEIQILRPEMKNGRLIAVDIDGNEVKSILDVSKFITTSTSEFIEFTVIRLNNKNQ